MDNWNKSRSEILHSEDYFPPLTPAGSADAQVFKSSPREGSGSVRLMYLLSIAAARSEILLSSSYFVPDDETVAALVRALSRGVRVEVIVPGEKIDTAITRRASRSRWGPLLQAGIAIYEFQPTMFHCKVMVVDRLWTSVGSTNFDTRPSVEATAPDTVPVIQLASDAVERRISILACPARDEADRLAMLMFEQLVDEAKWDVEVAGVETLTSELLARIAQEGRTIVCIGSLPPGGLAHTRYLCKRLRAQFPRIKILVGRWGLRGNVEANREQLQEAGADLIATTLLETRNQLESFQTSYRPALTYLSF